MGLHTVCIAFSCRSRILTVPSYQMQGPKSLQSSSPCRVAFSLFPPTTLLSVVFPA
ncbi:hypothetical protein CPB84DRAFT_1775108 [Gymnopilus junonius]|uniref:Uncharacterized protein n=1 Tax=Gymnopilus junonius TaxID=109634 RepID=A0A9P5TNB2_GYMJU|nr:hypothetical protein CPB84DRAFT_1775108 [Gymnopilus junonius]